jgi:hypothetical protein
MEPSASAHAAAELKHVTSAMHHYNVQVQAQAQVQVHSALFTSLHYGIQLIIMKSEMCVR